MADREGGRSTTQRRKAVTGSAAVLGDSPRERLALVFDGTHHGEGYVSLTHGPVLGDGSDLRREGLIPDIVRKLANRSPE